ncbi:MAG: esterase-like activity of phytase family protein [Flammeovirgaceae bacterium]
MKKLIFYLGTLAFLSACNIDSERSESVQISALRMIGEQQIPTGFRLDSTEVGGFSGIDYEENSDQYYIICDDIAERGATRFYRAKLEYDDTEFKSVSLLGYTKLLKPDGTDFPHRKLADLSMADPEALRYDAETNSLFWTSEGDKTILAQPFIRQANMVGKYLNEIPLPEMFQMKSQEKGTRHNASFEGLSLSADKSKLWVAMEAPLYEDGEKASYVETKSPIRISLFDKKTGALLKQYAYMLGKISKKPATDSTFYVNGVVEVLAIDDTRLLILERSYTAGYEDGGNSVMLYEVDLKEATDISKIPALANASYTPANKKLLLNFDSLQLKILDNIEGITWGKKLANGNRTLVVVSDNNFNTTQITQFIVFEVIP